MRTIVMACALSVAGAAGAKEVKVGESDVPKAALDAVTKKYPSAKKVTFERETEGAKVTYEVKLVDGARHIDVDVSADGKITAEEETIAPSELPPPVTQALAKSPTYAKWAVKRAERVVKGGESPTTTYEVVVARGKDKAELVFASDGKLVGTETPEKP